MSIAKPPPARLSVVGLGPGAPAGATPRVCFVSNQRQPSAPITYQGSAAAGCDGAAVLRPARPRNISVPSCRPMQRGDLLGEAKLRVGSDICGLGGGADGVVTRLRVPVLVCGASVSARSDRLVSSSSEFGRGYLPWPGAARGCVVRFQRSVYLEQASAATFLLSTPWGGRVVHPSCARSTQSMPREYGERGASNSVQAAARAAINVSIVRGGRRFCSFAGRQQLAGWAPVSRMPLGVPWEG